MSPSGTDTPVNIDELKEIMDDDIGLIRECFDDFVQEWPAQYVDIKSAILENDAQRLDDAAHKLKGTLRYLAAGDAADAAYALESAGKENNLSNAETQLSVLKDECQKLVEFINKFSG